MLDIIFYEKPGCISNRKQKNILRRTGYRVESVDLLRYPWRRDELARFFTGLAIKDWFNPSAPGIRNGDVDVSGLDQDSALDLLLDNPLLIKRPLLRIEDRFLAGFSPRRIERLTGIRLRIAQSDDVDRCNRSGVAGGCP